VSKEIVAPLPLLDQMGTSAAAIEDVYRQRYASFRNAFAAMTGSYEQAHDIVQEGFATALERRDEFRGEGALEGWIWRISFRVALRAMKRPDTTPIDEAFEARLPDPTRDPVLDAALRALPAKRRTVAFLRYVADLSYQEIAEICEIAPGTVAATLAQARSELALALGHPSGARREEVVSGE
jgi:RNA polymerase sigma-70 factor, ECF subfamily